ncbi:MAG TPA: autotransporter-associated beta strand repeat-containing protein, partial [Verrucomicrobiae bacterium]
TTNFNVSIYNTLQHSGIGGDNATDGGLTKRGNGMLTLADNYYSSYTGPTFVAGGTLSLYPNSIINLNSLMVSNAALNLNITGGAATFNAASVKFNGNNTLNLNYDVMASTPPTTLNVSGGLTVAGTTTINIFGYGWTAGQQIALVDYSGTPLANLSNFVLGALPYGVTANLSNNVANTSIDLVITAVSLTSWIPLLGTDPVGISSFNSSGLWQDGSAPSAGKGYLTRTFAVRSPADSNPYTFGGSALSVDVGGRFIMKGTGGQVMTVDNLILNGGLVDYANSGDNLTETLGGNITLQAGLTSYIGALGSGGASETLYVTATIGGSGNLQISGSPASNAGSDLGVVVLAATNSYTGNTTVATGTLLVNGHNGSSPITVNANATLGGNGLVGSTVNLLAGSTLAPGTPTRGALTAALGTLTANGTAAVSGAVVMKLNRDAITNSDQFGAAAITINPGATLTVNNLSTTPLAGGDTFTLFSGPVSGSFSTVTLPTLASTNLYWTNNLAVNGSISVVAPVTVNTSSTNVMATISGNTLTLAWPSDHKGWHLQVQTNGLSGGLGTNWITIPGSDTVTSTNIQINPANGSVFFRMVYP